MMWENLPPQLPDLSLFDPLKQGQIDWLVSHGVSTESMISPEPLRMARGVSEKGNFFEFREDGERWLAFHEANDVVFWHPRRNVYAGWTTRAFCIGESVIHDAMTYSKFGGRVQPPDALHLFEDPLQWLAYGRRGIVVLRWDEAFDKLRFVSKISVSQSLKDRYEKAMQPRLPSLHVRQDKMEAAA